MESFATLIKNRRSTRKFTGAVTESGAGGNDIESRLDGTGIQTKILGSLLSWKIRRCWPSCRCVNRQELRF